MRAESIERRLQATVLVLVVLGSSCSSTGAPVDELGLYPDLGDHARTISTDADEAQRCFDQGLTLAYAFNHGEAIRLFEKATSFDPECAMAWWGIALVNGPHINNPTVDAERARHAWSALQEAREHAALASPLERELIDALGKRYSADPAAERRPLDEAYAEAMRLVWRAHPDDADVATLYAEALMDLQPWDLWTRDGKPKHATEEIVATLEAALALDPTHPGANHLYVHTMEASMQPEKALPAADRLRTLVPGAGHLVHMPAHIDLRLGHYADASLANVRAIEADRRSRELIPKAGFYRVYMAHNHHFLAFTSMMEGRSAAALGAARTLVAEVPPEFIEEMGPVIDGYMPIVLHVLLRFGRWKEILDAEEFPADLTVANTLRLYARGVALTALGRLDEAEAERAKLDSACEQIGADRTVGNNPARAVLAVARDMLAAELLFAQGKHDASFAVFRRAAAAEDELVYDEPPDWMMPVRHAFGAALLQARRLEEAEKVYEEDLRRFPENGWSLYGLSRALELRGERDRAAQARKRFDAAWECADVKLSSSCFCQPGPDAPAE
jgi:tetratricopeptide (TPR) repeat protein